MLEGSEICRILPTDDSRSAGKIRTGRPDPDYGHPRPALLSSKYELCSEVFDFSEHFRNARPCKACSSKISAIRDNIQLLRKRQRAVAGKPNNDPSLSSPHVESTTTVSLRTLCLTPSDSCTTRRNRQKRGSTHQPLQVSPEGFRRNSLVNRFVTSYSPKSAES